jgi:transcription-repair coupling factor (superfamily II helicase)
MSGAGQPDTVEALLVRLAERRRVRLEGPSNSHAALLLARLVRSGAIEMPLVLLVPAEEQAQQLSRDLTFFLGRGGELDGRVLPRVTRLPAVDASPYAELSADGPAAQARASVLAQLLWSDSTASTSQRSGAAPVEVLVCSAPSLQRKVIPRQVFLSLSARVSIGETIDRDDLSASLVAAGYERCDVVDDPGTFAVRGGLVDIYPPTNRFPTRIELFGDEVESIRLFDSQTQRTLRQVDSVEIYPVREVVRPPRNVLRERLLGLADQLDHPTRAIRALIDRLEADRHCVGVEAFVPAFYEHMEPLWSYLGADISWVLFDPPGLQIALAEQLNRFEQAYRDRVHAGQLAFEPAEFLCTPGEVEQRIDRAARVELGGPSGHDDDIPVVRATTTDHAQLTASLARARAARGEEILTKLAEQMHRWTGAGELVVVAAGDQARADKLDALLRAHEVQAVRRDQVGASELLGSPLPDPAVWLQPGELSAGFRSAEGLVLISHEEILGPRARRRTQKRPFGARLGDLRQLSDGDPIVHAEHGIGRYRGLVQLSPEGVAADFLLLEYAAGDRLYLPVHRLSQVQRYVGADGRAPALDKLGGATWERKRRKAEADVRRFSEELLQLYAQRAALSGRSHTVDAAEYAEFEATFPFNETPDQLEAIGQTLQDLAEERPMDRLVCGDVGFGKTEVALRAAFVAAMAGRQVAVLAPTTVLVEQHFRTFTERLAPYPLRVESVSRFRRPTELRQILPDISAGRVDVVVGTHRLLSADVRFKDLGLLVIDEEQRFGVKHKEWLKRMRTQVDVLAMTATPIPRTLQLSMVGLREISLIATPPADRLAIRTVTCRYDEALVRDAIRKELSRGGQVFFVHNEVQTIDEWAERLRKLVPDARIAVGHGQMDARRLERVMVDFVKGRYDVLVCTTIVESGLDIPRVNTMFVNRAHRFGLSQLYQIRGRIGRSHMRAYCYLLVPDFERMSDEARERVKLLQQFTELGSGFSIASHDLELRGAGDLLGNRQSGHVAALGFDAYARILEDAVAELKGEPIVRETDPDLNIKVAAFIPQEYVEDTGQRLDLYKRLSDVCSEEGTVKQLLAEIADRYGQLPQEVQALGQLMVVKGLAMELKAAAVELTSGRLTLTLLDETPLAGDLVAELVGREASRFALRPPARLVCRLATPSEGESLRAAEQTLRELIGRARERANTA